MQSVKKKAQRKRSKLNRCSFRILSDGYCVSPNSCYICDTYHSLPLSRSRATETILSSRFPAASVWYTIKPAIGTSCSCKIRVNASVNLSPVIYNSLPVERRARESSQINRASDSAFPVCAPNIRCVENLVGCKSAIGSNARAVVSPTT